MILRGFRGVAPALGAAFGLLVAACGHGSPGPGPGPGTTVTVTAVAPSTGSTFGGTPITITGSGFSSGASVLVGGTAATDVAVVSSTSITAKTPAHAAGAGDVRVTVGSKTDTLAGAFTFVTPTIGPNAPPTVGAISVTPPRKNQPRTLASIGDRISLTSSINDAESALSDLTIQWTATPDLGTFEGSGASVQWTAPSSTTSPVAVSLKLTVVEKYFEADANGLPIEREHRITRTIAVQVHDTVKEVGDMAVDFLTLFSNSTKSPEEVLHNFSQTCDGGDGYAEEYGDIVKNREDVVIMSFVPGTPGNFEYDFRSQQACTNKAQTPGDVCVEVPWSWTDYVKALDTTRTVSGTDFVTGVYEDSAWRLCHSRWTAFDTLTGQPVQMDFDRRRIIKGPVQK